MFKGNQFVTERQYLRPKYEIIKFAKYIYNEKINLLESRNEQNNLIVRNTKVLYIFKSNNIA